EQAEAAAQAKAAEDAKVAAEKAKQIQQEKVAAAEQGRAAAEKSAADKSAADDKAGGNTIIPDKRASDQSAAAIKDDEQTPASRAAPTARTVEKPKREEPRARRDRPEQPKVASRTPDTDQLTANTGPSCSSIKAGCIRSRTKFFGAAGAAGCMAPFAACMK